MKNVKTISSQIILIVIALIFVNVLSERFFLRLDFTEEKIYTLSDATKSIIKNLDEPVTIVAYFTRGSQQEIEKARRDLRDLLVEYANLSGGMVNYEFLNPNDDPQIEQEAMQAGIQPLLISVREKDQVKQQRIFLGVKITKGEVTDVIPVIQPGAAMEYALSSSIKKISVIDKPKIGIVQGHGEPSLSAMPQAITQLEVLYNIEPVELSNPETDLSEYRTLAIIAPADSFPQPDLQRLDEFLANGGSLYLALNQVEGDFQTMRGNLVQTNLTDWLSEKGITIEKNCVVDASSSTVGVRQQTGFMTFTRQIPFPYWPMIKDFDSENTITTGLNQVGLQLTSVLNFSGDTTLRFTPFLKTSKKSGTLPLPVSFNVQKEWTNKDFPLSNLTVGALLEGPIESDTHSAIIIIGNGNFAINGEGQEAQQHQPDNINLMVNAIDYLSDDTGLVGLRTKEVTSRPLDEIEEGRRALIKWINFGLPILLIIIYGIVRAQIKRRQRTKRMEVGNV
jgi:gliding-associated putative ABC transporter substrate-binding component GldG